MVQELVGIVPWTFIAQICNLFIQMYLIKRFLFKPINEMLEKRRAAADAEITDAEAAKKKANAIKEEYEQNMRESRAKVNKFSSARRNSDNAEQKIVKEASEQAAALKNKAEKEIAQEKKKAVNEVKGEIGIAMDIAGKVIEREINEKDHEKLIDEFISNVGEAS